MRGATDTHDEGATTTPTDERTMSTGGSAATAASTGASAAAAAAGAAAGAASPSAAAAAAAAAAPSRSSFGFGSFAQASGAQHRATHLAHAASPSLSGELLRQSLSAFLRTQVAHVAQALVLQGFNGESAGGGGATTGGGSALSAAHMARVGPLPVQQGKLCYAVLTQCEIVLIDRAWIGTLSNSVIAPSYAEIMRASQSGKQMAMCVPYHTISELRVDSEREDLFQLVLREDRGVGFPARFVLSSVHRKSFCEQLTALYNSHFLLAAMMPDPQAALSAASQAALLSHAQVAASRHAGPDGLASPGAPDPLAPGLGLGLGFGMGLGLGRRGGTQRSGGVGGASDDSDHLLLPHNQFSVLTTSANHTSTLGRIRKLKVVFDESDGSGSGGPSGRRTTYKHPSEQFFASLPSKYRGQIFHRCGYMFEVRKGDASAAAAAAAAESSAAPSSSSSSSSSSAAAASWAAASLEAGQWVDQAALFLNRPTSTYRWECRGDAERMVPLHQRKHLQVCFCPERSVSPFSNVVRSRDLRGHAPGRALGKASLKELLRGRDDCDDDDFFAWSESVGRAVAMNECRLSGDTDYFVPQSLVHTKKANPLGDKSSWLAFKMHLYLPAREVGVVALRRKCLPPYFDTFQDMVFVLYGSCATTGTSLKPREDFMAELEMLVDTLSPSVVPLPFHYTGGLLSLSVIHPTYADSFVLQGRVNALLNNSASYAWLATRAWMSSQRGSHGVFPTTEFFGTSCHALARAFANSILVRVTHRRERVAWAEYLPVAIEGIGAESSVDEAQPTAAAASGGGGDKEPEEAATKDGAAGATTGADGAAGAAASPADAASAAGNTATGDESSSGSASQRSPLVADPMVIVSRMLTEFAAAEAAERRRLGPQTRTYSAEEEWRCRVSQYLAYCVDDGIFPGALNLKRLLSVLTRAFLDAPILSQETSVKLDRVVDFLLYMKRRCAAPIELPSLRAAQQAVRGSGAAGRVANTANNGGGGSTSRLLGRGPARAVKLATAELAGASSPFASLASQSPSSLFIEGVPGGFDYDESSTLLEKLRDPSLLANFSCNEHIMIPLLDTSYIESLEKSVSGTAQASETSVIPGLLAALLVKDYNIDLIRAVKDKIVSYQLTHEILIAPLIALLRDGTTSASNYALQALSVLARAHPRKVVDAGGAAIPMWLVFSSRNELLLSAAIDLLTTLFTPHNRSIFSSTALAVKLVDLLRLRVGQQRYCSSVLQKTCRLVTLMVRQLPELLPVFLSQYAHSELVSIIGAYHLYHPILLDLSCALGSIFVQAKGRMLAEPSQNAQEDSAVLVRTLAHCTTRAHLRIALNMLLALQTLIRLPKPYYARLSNTMKNPNKAAGIQFTAPDPAFTARVNVLQHLHTKVGLENVLDRLTSSAEVEERRCDEVLLSTGAMTIQSNGTKVVALDEGDTSDPMSTAAREAEMKEQRKIAINVKKIARWFKARMNYAVSTGWNANMIWQLDNTKNFLASAPGQ